MLINVYSRSLFYCLLEKCKIKNSNTLHKPNNHTQVTDVYTKIVIVEYRNRQVIFSEAISKIINKKLHYECIWHVNINSAV